MKIVRKLICAYFNILCILSFCFFSFSGIKAKAYAPIEAVIPVSCLEIPDSSKHTYEIAIESQSNNAPVPASDTLSITESGTGEFTIEITEPGTFVYKVYEKTGTDINIVYDDTVYFVTVFVTNTEENSLNYAVAAINAEKNTKNDKVTFKDVLSSDIVITTSSVVTEELSTSSRVSVTTVTETSTSAGITSDSSDRKTIINDLISSVMTGDSMPIRLLFIIIGVSLAVALIMIMLKKRKNDERRQ